MITLQNINKQFGSKVLYNSVSLGINPQYRIGCVGPNGAGKTLLLRILAGQDHVDSGEVCIPSQLKIGYLPQEIAVAQDTTPLQMVLEPFKHLFDLESITETIASHDDTESAQYRRALREYDSLHTQRSMYDADALHARAKSILAGLGVIQKQWERSIHELSGGYYMRVLLAQLLLQEPDFLLLDEPTNHLDMDSLIWLEKYLQRYKSGMLIVSHDRDFLNRITTHTMEILHGRITLYTGTVDAYVQWKETNSIAERRRVKNIQGQIAQTETFITRFKSKNTKASQARSKMKHLDRLKELLPEQIQSAKTIRLRLPEPVRCGSVPLQLENVTVSYGSLTALDNFSANVCRGDKIAIIGPNGAGKSTLLKTCFGSVKPASGTVTIGHNTVINYYSQHRLEQLEPQWTVYETIAAVAGTSNKTYIQSLLGAFLFSGDDVLKKVEVLSGGEKSRLSLATLLANPGNVLLFDEPTNHLDIDSIEQLAVALSEYDGTMLIVSHDEYFLSRICNRIIELRPGMHRDFPGSLSDYRSYIESGYIDPFVQKPQQTDQTVELDKQERMQRREKRKKQERAITKVERAVALIEQQIGETKQCLNDPQNASDYTLLHEAQKKLEKLDQEYESQLREWEILQQEIEENVPE